MSRYLVKSHYVMYGGMYKVSDLTNILTNLSIEDAIKYVRESTYKGPIDIGKIMSGPEDSMGCKHVYLIDEDNSIRTFFENISELEKREILELALDRESVYLGKEHKYLIEKIEKVLGR